MYISEEALVDLATHVRSIHISQRSVSEIDKSSRYLLYNVDWSRIIIEMFSKKLSGLVIENEAYPEYLSAESITILAEVRLIFFTLFFLYSAMWEMKITYFRALTLLSKIYFRACQTLVRISLSMDLAVNIRKDSNESSIIIRSKVGCLRNHCWDLDFSLFNNENNSAYFLNIINTFQYIV